jgi:hypothetical protein
LARSLTGNEVALGLQHPRREEAAWGEHGDERPLDGAVLDVDGTIE